MNHLKSHRPVCIPLKTFSSSCCLPYSKPIATARTINENNTHDMSSQEEPTTGPLYWEKRRAEWLHGPTRSRPESVNGDNNPPSRARARLEALLASPLAEEDDVIWNDTVGAIWKGLSRGDRLKKNLPLPLLIKILRGGWLRDGTWPRNLPIPPDDPNDITVPEPLSRSQH
ncbi:hypothetical protein FRC15_001921 [Serendipita sp. 397]|nr:hypothetical protein FRC15_001921 [Serendipita sp. 397]